MSELTKEAIIKRLQDLEKLDENDFLTKLKEALRKKLAKLDTTIKK